MLWGLGPVFGLPGAVAVWAPQPPQLDAKPDEGPRVSGWGLRGRATKQPVALTGLAEGACVISKHELPPQMEDGAAVISAPGCACNRVDALCSKLNVCEGS